MSDALKPCPFCGHSEVVIRQTGRHGYHWIIECQECFAGGPSVYGVAEAIAKWNERKPPVVLDRCCHDPR